VEKEVRGEENDCVKGAIALLSFVVGALLFFVCFAAIELVLKSALPYLFFNSHFDAGQSPPESFPLIAEVPTPEGTEFLLVTWTGQLQFDQTHPQARYLLSSPSGRASGRFVNPHNKCDDATFEAENTTPAQVVSVRACVGEYFYDARYRVQGRSIVPESVRQSGGPGVAILATLAGLGLAYPISSTVARRFARALGSAFGIA
jgi:hypothetical protein